MLFWRRRKIYMGASAEEYAAVQKKLAESHVPFDIKTVSRLGSDIGGSRMPAEENNGRTQYMTLNYVYVDKKDYERATEILNTK